MNNIDIKEKLICPICSCEFETNGNSLICKGEKHHLFDFSSAGYVNLLSPGKSKNAKTGDDGDMIAARRRFLSSGHYDRISETLGEMIASYALTEKMKSVCIVDSGCGEGRHTCGISKSVAEKGLNSLIIGFDASKKGVLQASRFAKHQNIANPFFENNSFENAFFAAGNIFNLPVKDKSADFVTSLFAPIAGKENLRILKSNGKLIVAAAGASHLVELRKVLYENIRLSSGEVRCPEGFKKTDERILKYKTIVENNSLVRDLFTMTPFYYRTSLSDKAKLDKTEKLEITVEVLFCIFSPEK